MRVERRRRWLASLALVSILAGGCSKFLLVAPTGATITLFPATTVLVPLGGSLTITANVTNVSTDPITPTVTDKMPVQDGTLVTFTTNLGHFVSSQVGTVGGQAVATFVADTTAGAAKISAFSNSASASLDVTIGLAVDTVAVSAAPSTLPATGGTSVISARVQDASGNGVASATVTFKPDGVGNTVSPAAATTDASGNAVTILTAVTPATVTATALGKSGTVSVAVAGHSTVRIDPSPASGTVAFGTPMTFTLTPTAGAGTSIKDVTIDFGDGTTRSLGPIASATAVAHLYAKSGTFLVGATVTDTSGAVSTVFATVVVTATTAPTIALVVPTQVTVGVPAIFSVTPTTATGTLVTDVTIDFGDGTVKSLGPIAGASTASHVYATAGAFTVVAKVTDSSGATAQVSSAVVVTAATAPPPPTLTLELPNPVAVSTPAIFKLTASAGTGTTLTNVTIDFGDGTVRSLGAVSSSSVAHLYATAGTFTITATATASNGVTAPAVSTFVVIPLVASLTAPGSASTNSVLSFTVTPSTGASIDHYMWDFGDGATATSSGPTITHAYVSVGTFTVTVTVVPTVGAAVTTTAQVHVS